MNITFLIGNGFDIGIGLKSKFSDFFPLYFENSQDKHISLRGLADDIKTNIEEWSYFEKQLGIYLKNFNKDTKSVFLRQLKDFENEFIHYLEKEEKQIDYSDQNKIAKRMSNALLYFYSTDNLATRSNNTITNLFNVHSKTDYIYNFVNFNYTSVLEDCLSTINGGILRSRRYGSMEYKDKIGKIVNVHGYSKKNPIMGVNDESQIHNDELASDRRFLKYIVKPLATQAHRMNFDIEAEKIIGNSHIICVYGMSLGETDKKWWNIIIKWLKDDSNRQLVLFDYDEKYTSSTQIDWLEKEDFIIDKLSMYVADERIDVERFRERIHIAIHKNIFKIKLRKRGNSTLDQLEAYKEYITNESMLETVKIYEKLAGNTK